MYIPFWLIVIAFIAWMYFRNKKRNSDSGDQLTSVEGMWKQAEWNKGRVLEKSLNLEEYLQDERDMVNAMERDAIRLRERFKHDPVKQKEIAKDWMDYSYAVSRVKFAREMLDVDMGDDAYDSFEERVKEPYLAIQEISKRVEGILGDESSSKVVNDNLRRKSEAVRGILEKSSKES